MQGLTFDVGLNTGKFTSGISTMQGSLSSFASTTKTVATAIAGALGGIAIGAFVKDATQAFLGFEKQMINVGTLIEGNVEKLQTYTEEVKNQSVTYGKTLEDVSGGLYQVISAFGDVPEASKILDVALQASVAGISTTESAVNLLAAAMKGYGMTLDEVSAKKVSDLAFETVKLGQTTFDELASSIGKVTPIANAAGVAIEELFGAYATLTGVTGSTAEVTTQLKAMFEAIIAPSESMSGVLTDIASKLIDTGELTGKLADDFLSVQGNLEALTSKYKTNADEIQNINSQINALETKKITVGLSENEVTQLNNYKAALKDLSSENKELSKNIKETESSLSLIAKGMGTSIVETLGFAETLKQITEAAGGNTAVLKELFPSVEALNAVLALSGEQFDTFLSKTKAMYDSTGAASDAFKLHAESFYMSFEKLKQAGELVKTELGEVFAILSQPAVDFTTEILISLRPNVADFKDSVLNFIDEFNQTEGLQEKTELIILTAINFVQDTINFVGDAFGNLADYARTQLGIEKGSVQDLGDIAVVAQLAWSGFTNILEGIGTGIDFLADQARNALGISGDENTSFDIGDISVFAKLAWQGFSNAAEFSLEFLKGQIMLMLGQTESVDVGEIKAQGQAFVDISNVILLPAQIAAVGSFVQNALKAVNVNASLGGLYLTLGKITLAINVAEWLLTEIANQTKNSKFTESVSKTLGEDIAKGLEKIDSSTFSGKVEGFFAVLNASIASGIVSLGDELSKLGSALNEGVSKIFDTVFNDVISSIETQQTALNEGIKTIAESIHDTLKTGLDMQLELNIIDKKSYDSEIEKLNSFKEKFIEATKIDSSKFFAFDEDIKLGEAVGKVLEGLPTEITIPVKAETTEFETDFNFLISGSKEISIKLNAQDNVSSVLNSFENKEISINANTSESENKINNLKSLVDGLIGKSVDVLLSPIDNVSGLLKSIGEQTVQKTIEILGEDRVSSIVEGLKTTEQKILNIIPVDLATKTIKQITTDINTATVEITPVDYVSPLINSITSEDERDEGSLSGKEIIINVFPETTELDSVISSYDGKTIATSYIDVIVRETAGGGSGGGGSVGLAAGGFTPNVGTYQTAGAVHGGEWVAPRWMVESEKYNQAIQNLEAARKGLGEAQAGNNINVNVNVGTLMSNDRKTVQELADRVYNSLRTVGVI